MYTLQTENGDIKLNQSGEGTFLYNEAAAKQLTVNALYMWNGEWFLEPNHGIKWLEVREKKRSRQEILQLITTGLVKNPYIEKVVDISVNFKTEEDKRKNLATLNYTVLIDSTNIAGDITP